MVSGSTPLATRMPAVSYLHSSLTPASFLHLRFVIGNVVATNLYNDCSDSTLYRGQCVVSPVSP